MLPDLFASWHLFVSCLHVPTIFIDGCSSCFVVYLMIAGTVSPCVMLIQTIM